MLIEDILEKFGITATEALVNAIKTKLIQRRGASGSFASPVNASGRLADSITYVVTGSKLSILGDDYIYYLENGRKPGKVPFDKSSTKYGVKTRGENKGQPRGDFSVLSEWVENKPQAQSTFGWSALSDAKKSSLIYAIAKKQREQGSTIYRAGGSDLVSGIFNDNFVDSLQNEFMNLLTIEVESEILKLVA
jgi:hypothetical protein